MTTEKSTATIEGLTSEAKLGFEALANVHGHESVNAIEARVSFRNALPVVTFYYSGVMNPGKRINRQQAINILENSEG